MTLLDEHLFLITNGDPWYGEILTYIPKSFLLIPLVMIDGAYAIKTILTSLSTMHYTIMVLTPSFAVASCTLKLNMSSTIATWEHVVATSLAWPLPKKSFDPATFVNPYSMITKKSLNIGPISKSIHQKIEHHLPHYTLSFRLAHFANGASTSWNVSPPLAMATIILLL